MTDIYPIYLGSEQRGQAQMNREGLYHQINCSCVLSQDVPFQVVMQTSSGERSLGTCVQEGSRFRIRTKVPSKYIGEEKVRFYLRPKFSQPSRKVIAVYPDEPFQYLNKLQNARMVVEDDHTGVLLQNEL